MKHLNFSLLPFYVSFSLLSALPFLGACKASDEGEKFIPQDIPPLEVKAMEGEEEADVIWRYLDPQSQSIKSSMTISGIPEEARDEVVVYDPKRQAPAGYDFVADLRHGLPLKAEAIFHFRFSKLPALKSESPRTAESYLKEDRKKQQEVTLFATQGCPYCEKARKFFAAKQIPYTEVDIERDKNASMKLQSMAEKAGLSSHELQGVPIIFINGKPILGWDQRETSRLLGI